MSAAKSNKTENLRIRAEDLLGRVVESFQPADIEDINQLHQELAVHQAELELQNEELQNTQASLRKLRDRYIELFENAPVGYVLLDASGTIRRTNSTWNAMLEQPDADFCGVPFAETLLEEDVRIFMARFRTFFNNPAGKHMELRIKRYKSEPLHVQITAKRSYDEGEERDTEELMVVVSDITEQKQAAEALREQRDFSESLIETAQAIILVLDTRGRIVRFNPYMEELVGYELDEVKGLDWFEKFIQPENGQTLKPVFEKTLDGTPTRGNVNSIICKDGRAVIVEWHDTLLKDKDGCNVGVLAIGQDITERQKMEDALRRSEERFLLAMNASNDGLFDWNLETNEIYYSPTWKKMLGYEDHELPNDFSVWEKTTAPEDVKKSWELQQKVIAGQIDRFVMEFKMKHKEGHWVDILSRAKAIFNDNGKAIRMIGTHTDITERKQVQQKLAESEERFKALHNASFGGIFIHDEGIILDCNQELSEISGFDHDELIGMDGLLLLAEESREAVMNNIRSGYEKPYETVGLRKNGDEYPLRLEGKSIPYDGKTVRVVEFRDITEQKEAEAERESLQEQLLQSQKMESVGLLAGGVAHDFNNMLGVIIGHAEMQLRRMGEDDPGRKSVDNILVAARRSADLTRQLLAFARKQPIAPEVLDLNATVEGMLKMLRRLIGEDIDLVWNPGSNIPAVSMDPSQLNQILVNLSVNARDAIKDVGRITLETEYVVLNEAYCDVHTEAIPGKYILLAVSDNGCGMDEKIRSKIFDPFYTTKEQGKGTGLGLSTVYGIVKQNGGFINVYSESGRGTTFRIYIPSHIGETGAEPKAKALESIVGNGETILVVEDEPALLDMTCSILEELGYRVIPMGGPSPALAKISTQGDRPDLVITDVVMPGMNGKDMAERMLQTCPEIKVLFMSGYTSNTIVHHGVLEKGVSFIQKPFSVYDLGMKVRDILGS